MAPFFRLIFMASAAAAATATLSQVNVPRQTAIVVLASHLGSHWADRVCQQQPQLLGNLLRTKKKVQENRAEKLI